MQFQGFFRPCDFGNTEVENFDEWVGVFDVAQENVFWFQVAVHYSGSVRMNQRPQSLLDDGDSFLHGQPSLTPQTSPQILAAQEFEHHERHSVITQPGIEDVHDMRAFDQARGLSFTQESGAGLGILIDMTFQELQCNMLTNAGVNGFIDRAHAAASQLTDHAIFVGHYRSDSGLGFSYRQGHDRLSHPAI